jgi:hypothetical protein
MAQTGFTPIQLYYSSTTTNVPLAANLASGELAINITDGKLFYKDNANVVQVIGWKVVPTTAGGTGLTTYTAGDLTYYASGTTLTKLGIGASGRYLSSSGTAPQWSAPAGLTETDDTNVTMTLGGSPSTALLQSVSMTLGWTGTLATTRGGTGNATGAATAVTSNSTSGVMQITGPAAASTRVMTVPDANFTAARTDAAQTFTGNQTFNTNTNVTSEVYAQTTSFNVATIYSRGTNSATGNNNVTKTFDITNYGSLIYISASDGSGGLYFASWNSATITAISANANVVLSNAPGATQLGLFKSANSNTVSIIQGSNFTSVASVIYLGVYG